MCNSYDFPRVFLVILRLLSFCHTITDCFTVGNFPDGTSIDFLSSFIQLLLSQHSPLLVLLLLFSSPCSTCYYFNFSHYSNTDPLYFLSLLILSVTRADCVFQSFNERLASEKSVKMIFHLVESLSLLGKKFDSKVVSKTLHEALKTDDSALRCVFYDQFSLLGFYNIVNIQFLV